MPEHTPPIKNVPDIYKRLKQTESTCVAELSYIDEEQSMIVVFQKRGTYKYFDVPVDVFVDFNSAGLKGSYFNLYIRNQFSYERIA